MATIRRLPVGDFAFALLPKSAEKIAEIAAEMAAGTGAAGSANSVGSAVEIAEAAWEDAIVLDTVRQSYTTYSLMIKSELMNDFIR